MGGNAGSFSDAHAWASSVWDAASPKVRFPSLALLLPRVQLAPRRGHYQRPPRPPGHRPRRCGPLFARHPRALLPSFPPPFRCFCDVRRRRAPRRCSREHIRWDTHPVHQVRAFRSRTSSLSNSFPGRAGGRPFGCSRASRSSAASAGPSPLTRMSRISSRTGTCPALHLPVHAHNSLSSRLDWIGAFLVTSGLSLIIFVLSDGSIAPDGWKTGCEYPVLRSDSRPC